MASSDSDHHWVQDLFPPAFGITVDEIFAENFKETVHATAEEESEDARAETGPSVFDQAAKGISPLDVSAIRNVYERVWLMTTLEEQERKKREEKELAQKAKVAKTRSRQPGDTRPRPEKVDADTSTTDLQLKSLINIHEPSIWSSQEISVLRAVFKTAKEQNSNLQTMLKITSEELDKLKTNYAKQNKVLESRSKNLTEAKKANQRLQILSENLKSHLDKVNKKVANLSQELEELKTERRENLKQIHKQQIALDKERLERRRLEMDLETERGEALRMQKLQGEKLKIVHEREIQVLREEMADLAKQLKQEKEDHERSKRGLTHLRQHFSSLPLAGEYIAAGAVTEDQLTKWTL